jgi:hypothetical protein
VVGVHSVTWIKKEACSGEGGGGGGKVLGASTSTAAE